MSAGRCVASVGKNPALTCSESRCNCRIAAGRRISVLTNNTRFLWDSISQRASLPAVVVLPAPCKPASSTTTGGWARSSNRPLFVEEGSPPMSATSSPCRMPTKACPGVRLAVTSAPSAFCLTRSMKVLTTGSATSASSSAMRTSRSDSPTFSSVMRPRPRRVSTVRLSRAVRFSNRAMGRGLSYVPYGKRTLARPWYRARSAAAADRVLLGNRSGHVVGQPLQDSCRRQGRQAHRPGARLAALQARQLARCEPGGARTGERRGILDRHLVSPAHSIRTRHTSQHGSALGVHDRLLRARAQDLCRAQARSGRPVVYLHLQGAGVPRDTHHVVHQQGGVRIPADLRSEACGNGRQLDVRRRSAFRGGRGGTDDSHPPPADVAVHPRPRTRHRERH